MDNFTNYISQLAKLENADSVNELNAFCVLNKSVLSFLTSVWEPLQALLSSESVTFSLVNSLQNALPILSSIKNEYEDLLAGRVSDLCKKELVDFRRRIQNTTIDNCGSVLEELRALIARNKASISLPSPPKQPSPTTAVTSVKREDRNGYLSIVCVGYDGLIVSPTTKLYFNGNLLGSFSMSQGYSIKVPLNSSRLQIELKGGLGLKRGFFSEVVDIHNSYFIEFNYNYFTGHYKSTFYIQP